MAANRFAEGELHVGATLIGRLIDELPDDCFSVQADLTLRALRPELDEAGTNRLESLMLAICTMRYGLNR